MIKLFAIAPSGGSSIPAQGSTFRFTRTRLNIRQILPAYFLIESDGGAERDRTVDPLLAKQVLSQLSYSPLHTSQRLDQYNWPEEIMVGLGRFELPTSPLSGVRSNQLSYRPDSTAPDYII